jgi:hypothetical protein
MIAKKKLQIFFALGQCAAAAAKDNFASLAAL